MFGDFKIEADLYQQYRLRRAEQDCREAHLKQIEQDKRNQEQDHKHK